MLKTLASLSKAFTLAQIAQSKGRGKVPFKVEITEPPTPPSSEPVVPEALLRVALLLHYDYFGQDSQMYWRRVDHRLTAVGPWTFDILERSNMRIAEAREGQNYLAKQDFRLVGDR